MILLIDKILDYTYDIVVAIAMIYSIYLWVKKGYTAKQKYFFLYLVAVLIVDVFGLLIRKTFDLPQAYLYFPFIIFSILYLTLVRYFNQKINLLVLTLLSINCFFLYGRSGIVVGLLLLLFGVYYKFGLRFFIFLSLVTSVFLGAIFYYISTS